MCFLAHSELLAGAHAPTAARCSASAVYRDDCSQANFVRGGIGVGDLLSRFDCPQREEAHALVERLLLAGGHLSKRTQGCMSSVHIAHIFSTYSSIYIGTPISRCPISLYMEVEITSIYFHRNIIHSQEVEVTSMEAEHGSRILLSWK